MNYQQSYGTLHGVRRAHDYGAAMFNLGVLSFIGATLAFGAWLNG